MVDESGLHISEHLFKNLDRFDEFGSFKPKVEPFALLFTQSRIWGLGNECIDFVRR
jgi:hypothetical protein